MLAGLRRSLARRLEGQTALPNESSLDHAFQDVLARASFDPAQDALSSAEWAERGQREAATSEAEPR